MLCFIIFVCVSLTLPLSFVCFWSAHADLAIVMFCFWLAHADLAIVMCCVVGASWPRHNLFRSNAVGAN